MKRVVALGLCLMTLFTPICAGDGMMQILDLVVRDSPRLKAAAEACKASQAENAGIRKLDAPEFEYGMLLGSDNIGNRNDFSVKQSFDIATISGKKNSLAGSLDAQSAYLYKAERIEVIYDACVLLADIVYYNGLIETLTDYQSAMKSLYDKTERSLTAGKATAMDIGKVRLQLSSATTATAMAVTERATLIGQLRTLSGHPDLDFTGLEFEYGGTDGDFAAWLDNAVDGSPLMQFVRTRVKSGELQLDIDKMAWAPKLDVGYMAELARDEKYRGVTVGVSIPLWSNAANVRRSRAAVSQAKADDNWQEQEFITAATNAWNKAHSLEQIASESQSALELSDTRALLGRALESGELSILDYLIELGMYYDAVKENLQVRQEYHHALSELARFAGL